MPTNPRDKVFTTLVWDGGSHLADLQLHLERMEKHAKRLRIAWPEHILSMLDAAWSRAEPSPAPSQFHPYGLIRLELSREGQITIQSRQFVLRNDEFEAVTVPAPRWSPKINGTKHGDWEPYVEATKHADAKGADLALLVHEFAIIDGDRATPLVIDEDGTAWLAAEEEGGVQSVTADILTPLLEASGVPVHHGRLNERMVARALEMVAIGSGVGASRIASIDGETIGNGQEFTQKCQAMLTQHYQNENAWTHVGA